MGYIEIEESKSKRATCDLCGEKIKDDYRVKVSARGGRYPVKDYYHVDCIKEMIDDHETAKEFEESDLYDNEEFDIDMWDKNEKESE